MIKRIFSLALLALAMAASHARAADADGVIRIPIECEEMKGVEWKKPGSGFTPVWTAGRWGYDLHQNMIFGGVWSSRMANAVTDASATPSEVFQDVEVPKAGHYKIWAKYEVPPFFNYPFGIRVQPIGGDGKPAAATFDKVYGLRESPKHFSFTDKLKTGDLFWNWGMDHDAAEGYEADLPAGKVRVTLYKAAAPAGAPVGARSVDAILITSLITELSNEKFNRFPLIDELQKANHLYARFKNSSDKPVVFNWNHWNHHADAYYSMDGAKAAMVRFYDEAGKILNDDKGAPRVHTWGQWTDAVAPGAKTPWIDIGPTVTTENSCPFHVHAALPSAPGQFIDGLPIGMELALAPSDKAIVKTLAMDANEPHLDVLIQPDINRKEGQEATAKTVEVTRRATAVLNSFPRVGPVPSKLRLYGGVSLGYWGGGPLTVNRPDFSAMVDYAIGLGLNTYLVNTVDGPIMDATKAYYAGQKTAFIEQSGAFHHTQDVELFKKNYSDPKLLPRMHYVSFGDEIGLPSVDITNQELLKDFHGFLQSHGVKPADLGVANFDAIKPMNAYSAEVAVQIGVLPKAGDAKPKLPEGEAGKFIKRLYWWSTQFAVDRGVKDFAAKTKAMTAHVGPHFKTSANLGGMHPYYWMHQSSFIESFKGGAMTLAWSEDYDYCQPEVTRLVVDFQAAYLRAAKYHDTPMMFYCMPHWPGNTGQHVVQNAVTLWGQGIKDLDFFNAGIDAYATENYIHSRGGHAETGRGIRTVSGMAGNIEDALMPARTKQARVAILLSECSDTWETGGQGQGIIAPGSKESNVSQEERKNIWYCLRNSGYLVDLLTENDVAEGRLKDYKALYVCGKNLDRRNVEPISSWVKGGGRLFLTAGAARKDQYDEPMTDLDALVGRGAADASSIAYGGPLRAKMELLQIQPIDTVNLTVEKSLSGEYERHAATFSVLASRELFVPASGAQVVGTYVNGGAPAMVGQKQGAGCTYYTGTLPGQAYVRKGLMPARPMGKGGPEFNFSQWEPLDFDQAAAHVILLPVWDLVPDAKTNRRGVVANILESKDATIVTVINMAKQTDGKAKEVEITLPGVKEGKKIRTAMKESVKAKSEKNGLVIKLDELDEADVIVIER